MTSTASSSSRLVNTSSPGEFARVRITDCDVHDLYAEPL
jgi:hypothetical protein